MIIENSAFMYSASILIVICYVSELYTTIQHASRITNVHMRNVLTTIGSSLALVYSIRTNNVPLLWNFTALFSLNMSILLIRLYYTYLHKFGSNTNVNAIDPTVIHPVSSMPNTLLNEPMNRMPEGTLPALSQSHPSNNNNTFIITPIPWLTNLSQIVLSLFRKDTATTSISNETPRIPHSQIAMRIAPIWSYISLSRFLPSRIFSGHEDRNTNMSHSPIQVVPQPYIHGYSDYVIGRSIPSSHGGDILPPGRNPNQNV